MIIATTGLDTASETAAGYGVLRSLQARSGIDVIGLADEPLETCLYQNNLMKKAYLIPFPKEDSKEGVKEYLKRLSQIQSDFGLDVLIPNLNKEIPFLIHHVSALNNMGIKTLLPSRKSIGNILKKGLHQRMKKRDISFRLPAMVGYDSKFYLSSLAKAPVQNTSVFRSIADDEFSITLLADRNGSIAGLAAVKKLQTSPGGSTWMAVGVDDQAFSGLADDLVNQTGWTGPMTINMTRNKKRDICITDIHPVFPDWINFAAACGANLPSLLIDIVSGKNVSRPCKAATGRLFVRTSIDIVTDIERFGIFSLEGELTYDAK